MLEEELARSFPKTEVPEKMTFVNELRVNLSLGISKELMGKLKRVQDLECQRRQIHVTLEDCLEKLVAVYLEKNDPLEKAKRAQYKKEQPKPDEKEKNTETITALEQSVKNPEEKSIAITQSNKVNSFLRPVHERAPLSSALKHHIWYRDQGQCTHRNTKDIRCESRRYLQVHHVKPVEYGGTNTPENLAVLCFAHHQMMHAY